MQTPIITPDFISRLRPCYDPIRHLPSDYSGTVIDFLGIQAIPAMDRLWVVARETVLPFIEVELLAIRWARRSAHATGIDELVTDLLGQAEKMVTQKEHDPEEMLKIQQACHNIWLRQSHPRKESAAMACQRACAPRSNAFLGYQASKHAAWAIDGTNGGPEAQNQVQDIIDLLTFNALVHP